MKKLNPLLSGILAGAFNAMTDTSVGGDAPPPAAKSGEFKKPKAKPTKKAAAKPAKKAKKGAPKGAKAGKGIAVPVGPAALKQYAPEYHKDKEKKTAGGNVSVDNNDEIAQKFRGKTLDDIYKLVGKACAPDMDEAALRKKYKHLNVGMQRMNLGNRYRGVLNAK